MNQRAQRRAGTVLAGAMILALTACGGGGEAPEDEPTDGTASADDYYPHTMQTLMGEVTIEQEPERVVALWSVNANDLYALGVTPIASAGDPAAFDEEAPWTPEEVREIAQPELVTADGPNVEAIAALEPDLIVSSNVQLQDESVYEQLSTIAPTIAPDDDGLNPDWDMRLRFNAEAVNASDQAEEIIAQVEQDYAAVGDQVPGIEDMTYNWAGFTGDQYGFGNGSVFELFGLSPAESQDNSNTEDAVLSQEQTSQLDADLLVVWPYGDGVRETLDSDPLFQALPSVQAGTVVYADLDVADALNVPDPVALPWFLEKITPAILALGE